MADKLKAILLIEGDLVVAQHIMGLLSEENGQPSCNHFRIKHLIQASSALECLLTAKFDLVLMDIDICKDDFEMCSKIQKVSSDALILILTSLQDENLAHRALSHGANDYILKDQITKHWIFSALRYLLKSRATQIELTESKALSLDMSKALTTERARSQEMSYLARHDFLTGLPNRSLLTERVTQSIRLARRHKKQAALLYLDLDRFKIINDKFGHAVGDQLLKQVAVRLVAGVRDTDTVFRLGGDEFLVLLTEIKENANADYNAEKLREVLSRPYYIEGNVLRTSASIGISVYPENGDNIVDLMKYADDAMYFCKKNSRKNQEQYYTNKNTPLRRSV